jgi:hypothetical protein
MPKLRVARDERGVHRTKFVMDSPPYKMGQRQAELSMTRYHTLAAALTKKYTYADTPRNAHGGYLNLPNNSDPTTHNIDASALLPGSRQTIDLSSYKASTLEPIPIVKLHPRADGTIHPGDLSKYREVFEDNWKTQEGGILYCVAESRKFWNCLISYHGPTKSTGIKEWDDLFHRLESMGHAKRIIPCMVRVSLFLAETQLDSFWTGVRMYGQRLPIPSRPCCCTRQSSKCSRQTTPNIRFQNHAQAALRPRAYDHRRGWTGTEAP